MPYYNTTNQTGDRLKQAEEKVEGQNELVLEWFQWKKTASPTDVWRELFEEKAPITSVRRAITNLTDDGYLKKTDVKVMGAWGWDEHVWILNEGEIKPVVKTKSMTLKDAMVAAETSTSPVVMILYKEVIRLQARKETR